MRTDFNTYEALSISCIVEHQNKEQWCSRDIYGNNVHHGNEAELCSCIAIIAMISHMGHIHAPPFWNCGRFE